MGGRRRSKRRRRRRERLFLWSDDHGCRCTGELGADCCLAAPGVFFWGTGSNDGRGVLHNSQRSSGRHLFRRLLFRPRACWRLLFRRPGCDSRRGVLHSNQRIRRWGIRSCACPCLWRQRKCRRKHGIRLWQRLLLFWRTRPLRLWCRGGHGRGRCCERRGRLCVWRSCVLGTLLPPLVVNCESHLSAPACTALFSRASARCSLASARCLAVMRPQRAAACDR